MGSEHLRQTDWRRGTGEELFDEMRTEQIGEDETISHREKPERERDEDYGVIDHR